MLTQPNARPDSLNDMSKGFNAQTEEEFQNLMPISGTVDTFFGGFELDHSFPTHEAAERIYDLMDHQRAAQLYLWGIPLVGMTRWHLGNAQTYTGYDYNTLLYVKTFNERRGILTANETTDYFWGFSNTRDAALLLEMPRGLTVGMIVDMWQQGITDVGIFGPNSGDGDKLVLVGPNTPAETLPEPEDGQIVLRRFEGMRFDRQQLEPLPDGVKVGVNQLRLNPRRLGGKWRGVLEGVLGRVK